MTSEPDDAPRRRPPTIDLKATEVETEQPASTDEEAVAAGAAGERTEDESASAQSARTDFAGGAGSLHRHASDGQVSGLGAVGSPPTLPRPCIPCLGSRARAGAPDLDIS